jgi:predicted nucleic acid-binding protein
MTRYVIGPDVAIRLADDEAVIPAQHRLLAPALLRSQLLSRLYQAVLRGELGRKDASRRLDYVRGLRIRLLGDRVLQGTAWKVADQLGWPDTFDAEYIALTQLQADAFITLDRQLAAAVRDLVPVAPVEALLMLAGREDSDGKFAVSGAQPPEDLLQLLQRAQADSKPVALVTGESASEETCDDGSCAIG